jgi:acetyl-CoA acetyltransferase
VIPKLLITPGDYGVIEGSDAFASMAVYCKDVLKLPHKKMNPRGEVMVPGHPLGATDARRIVTGLRNRRRQRNILGKSVCIGTRQGIAGMFVNGQL